MKKEFESVADLPNDPFNMPPPYWRSSGTILHIVDALEEICSLLKKLRDVLPHINCLLDDYFDEKSEYEEFTDDADAEKFGDICEPLWELESKIKLKCELSVFMAAIEIEDLLNRVSVYNLHKDIAESIEKLSPIEKLQIISSTLTGSSIKDSKSYEALKKLISWRNAYAHGHCTDRPVKSLRHNHLISPEYYPTVPKEIEHMLIQLDGYLAITKHLRTISRNEYTREMSYHDLEIDNFLKQVKKYKFIYEKHGDIYKLEYKK